MNSYVIIPVEAYNAYLQSKAKQIRPQPILVELDFSKRHTLKKHTSNLKEY